MSSSVSGAQVGAIVGAVGGLIFVLVNAGAAAGVTAVVLRAAAVVLFLAGAVAVLRPGGLGVVEEPTPQRMRAFGLVVVAEVAAIPLGAIVLRTAFGLEGVGLAWVATVVGVHFLAFARIFPGAGFLSLGVVVTVLGVSGIVLVAAGADGDAAALVSGVATGFALLLSVLRSGFSTAGA